MKKQNLLATLEACKANPDKHDQCDWHCGTTHCFAGWANILASELSATEFEDRLENIENSSRLFNMPNNSSQLRSGRWAREWLDLTYSQGEELFHGCDTIGEIEDCINCIIMDGA